MFEFLKWFNYIEYAALNNFIVDVRSKERSVLNIGKIYVHSNLSLNFLSMKQKLHKMRYLLVLFPVNGETRKHYPNTDNIYWYLSHKLIEFLGKYAIIIVLTIAKTSIFDAMIVKIFVITLPILTGNSNISENTNLLLDRIYWFAMSFWG